MTVRKNVEIRYKCNFCSEIEISEGGYEIPDGWVELQIPEDLYNADIKLSVHICDSCIRDLESEELHG